MKKILYLTFYYEPDLCAGSFRNVTLSRAMSEQLGKNGTIDILTTFPNRYDTYKVEASLFEEQGNLKIYRIQVPGHKSGFVDQIKSFCSFHQGVKKTIKNNHYDLVFASSSRLFTAYLGYVVAKRRKIPLYVDIRDIIVDAVKDIIKNPIIKIGSLFVFKRVEKVVFNYASHINLISGGFFPHFQSFSCKSYSNYPNGIDNEFLDIQFFNAEGANQTKIITYAGNIGIAQGLEKIIPDIAFALGNNYKFLILGDGGTKHKLEKEIKNRNIDNIELKTPVSRRELLGIYNQSDFLFVHLSNYEINERVLPSKIFEYAAFNKPIIAGVAGFIKVFLKKNVPNVILFKPENVNDFLSQFRNYNYHLERRENFINKFRRENINKEMAKSILACLNRNI